MTCLNNSGHYLDVGVILTLFGYLAVFLPQRTTISQGIVAIDFGLIGSVLIFSNVYTNISEQDSIVVFLTTIAFAVLYFLLISIVGNATYLFSALLFVGTITFAATSHFREWFNQQFNIVLTNAAIISILMAFCILLIVLYSVIINNKYVQLWTVTIVFSILVTFGIRLWYIEGPDWKHDQVCCFDSDSCPIILNWWSFALFVFLVIFRMVWIDFCSRLYAKYFPTKKLKSSTPRSSNFSPLDTVDENQSLLTHRRHSSPNPLYSETPSPSPTRDDHQIRFFATQQ